MSESYSFQRLPCILATPGPKVADAWVPLQRVSIHLQLLGEWPGHHHHHTAVLCGGILQPAGSHKRARVEQRQQGHSCGCSGAMVAAEAIVLLDGAHPLQPVGLRTAGLWGARRIVPWNALWLCLWQHDVPGLCDILLFGTAPFCGMCACFHCSMQCQR